MLYSYINRLATNTWLIACGDAGELGFEPNKQQIKKLTDKVQFAESELINSQQEVELLRRLSERQAATISKQEKEIEESKLQTAALKAESRMDRKRHSESIQAARAEIDSVERKLQESVLRQQAASRLHDQQTADLNKKFKQLKDSIARHADTTKQLTNQSDDLKGQIDELQTAQPVMQPEMNVVQSTGTPRLPQPR